MFIANEDQSVFCTRGDYCNFPVRAVIDGEQRMFQPGDVVRFKAFRKKDCATVVIQRDFTVETETATFVISLTGEDTKIGEVISKPVDLWYEVELNPDTNPQTIVGYDENGAKIFKLFPEGKDVDNEDIAVVGKKTLQELVDYALVQARESGDFTGPVGPKGDPGPAEVFIAEYGVTSYAELDAAYNAGKALFCKEDAYLSPLYTRSDGGSYCFYSNDSVYQTNRYCTKSAGWKKKQTPLCASEFEKINSVMGDMEAALDSIIAIQEELIGGSSGGGSTDTTYYCSDCGAEITMDTAQAGYCSECSARCIVCPDCGAIHASEGPYECVNCGRDLEELV